MYSFENFFLRIGLELEGSVYVVFDFQALWRCLHNTPDSTANVSFRVLGKFGGSNRKMLPEAQMVNFS